jgi:hypothetical protein
MQIGTSQNNPQPRAAQNSAASEQRQVIGLFFQHYFYYIVLVEVIIIALLGYGFAVKPQFDAISAHQAEMRAVDEQTQSMLAQTEKKNAEFQHLLDAYNGISAADLAAINTLLPESQYLETLFSQLNAAARQNGIFLTAIVLNDETAANGPKSSRLEVSEQSAADAAADKGLRTVNLTLKVSGAGYPAFKNFLASLEQNTRLLDVSEVSYDPKSEAAEITLNAYYLPVTSSAP